MTTSAFPRRVAVGATALALAITGVTSSELSAPAQAADAPAAPAVDDQSKPAHLPNPTIPRRYLDQKIDWQLCSWDGAYKKAVPGAKDTLCAKVKVPMDWQAPDAHPDIELMVSYTPAMGESKGLVTSNPGGPGGSGSSLTQWIATTKPELAKSYDLLSFDPRGYGQSTRHRCWATQAELDALPTTYDYKSLAANTFTVQEAEARLIAKACSAEEIAPFISTQQTVYDMDFLRQLKGAGKLHYAGYSYGTWLGAWYADTYPEHTGRFILDSNLDWTGSMLDGFKRQALGFQRRRDQQLFPWIARHESVFHMGTTARAVRGHYEKVRARLVENAKKGHTYPGPSDLDWDVAMNLYTNDQLPAAAERIQAYAAYAANPEGGLPPVPANLAAQSPLKPKRELTMEPSLAIARAKAVDEPRVEIPAMGQAVRCNDSTYPTSRLYYVNQWTQLRSTYSFVGYWFGLNTCAYWPYHRDADRVVDLQGAPKMLMMQTEADPATETGGALAAHARTSATTRLVKVDDEGQHGVWGMLPSACANKAGDDFLLGGTLIGQDVTCGTTPLPGDQKVYELPAFFAGGRHTPPNPPGTDR